MRLSCSTPPYKTATKSKYFTFDIMLRDRFVCTLRYPLEKVPYLWVDGKPQKCIIYEELEEFILEKRPTLKGKDFQICF